MIALLCIFIVSFAFLQVPCEWLNTIFFIRDVACIDIKAIVGIFAFVSLGTFIIMALFVFFEWVKEQLGL